MQTVTPGIVLGISLLILAHATGAQPAIYRCEGESGVVFTDKPCESGVDPHVIDDSRVTVYTPAPNVERGPATPSTASPKAKRFKDKRSESVRAADRDQKLAKCAKLDQGLRDVRTKMRSGYGAKEGERLKGRQRQLNEQRRAQKCG